MPLQPYLSPSEYIDLDLVGSPPGLVATPLRDTSRGDNGLALHAGLGIFAPGFPRASAFDGSPSDGAFQHVDPGSNRMWAFRYQADSSSESKWYFVGGAPIYQAVEGARTATPDGGDAWIDFTGSGTQGPDWTTPIRLDCIVRFGARLQNNTPQTSPSSRRQVGVQIGSGTTPDDNNTATESNTSSSSPGNSVSRSIFIASLNAGKRLRLMFRDNSNTGTFTVQNAWMEVIPVRASN